MSAVVDLSATVVVDVIIPAQVTVETTVPPAGLVEVVTAGLVGPQGPQGAPSTVPGPQGPQGAVGAPSFVPGPQGPQGGPGAQGSQGPQGAPGVSNVPGPQGPQGAQGGAGPQGAAGAASTVPGPQGPQGAQGSQGTQGSQGAAGAAAPTNPGGLNSPDGYGNTNIAGQSLNQALRSGLYNGNNMANGPAAFGTGWVYVEVFTHVFSATHQRQVVWDMNGGTNNAWTRHCDGGDPTVAGAWTPWVQVIGNPAAPLLVPFFFPGAFAVGVKTVVWTTPVACTLTDATAKIGAVGAAGPTYRVLVYNSARVLQATGDTSGIVAMNVTPFDFANLSVPANGYVVIEVVSTATGNTDLGITLRGTVP